MFCRNCGKDLVGTPEVCANCGSHPVKGTVFCRYCGGPTNAEQVMCPKCGSAISTFEKASGVGAKSRRSWFTRPRIITAAVIIVVLYAGLAFPSLTVKPLQAALSDLIVSTIGYTSLPLDSITASPNEIPLPVYTEADTGAVFAVDKTQQLVIYAQYMNNTAGGDVRTGRSKVVTDKCVFQSGNNDIASVTSGGLVKGVAPGKTNIDVSYTAIPGSANLSSAAQGKVPVTFTVRVPVIVTER